MIKVTFEFETAEQAAECLTRQSATLITTKVDVKTVETPQPEAPKKEPDQTDAAKVAKEPIPTAPIPNVPAVPEAPKAVDPVPAAPESIPLWTHESANDHAVAKGEAMGDQGHAIITMLNDKYSVKKISEIALNVLPHFIKDIDALEVA